MVGSNIKHAPAYRNIPINKKSLKKRALEVNQLADSVTVTDILLANIDFLENKHNFDASTSQSMLQEPRTAIDARIDRSNKLDIKINGKNNGGIASSQNIQISDSNLPDSKNNFDENEQEN